MPVPASEETTGVPEFMRVQLHRVDSKPSVNVVLSTASSPERGSRSSLGVIDPWSVEDVVTDAAPAQVSLLGLRVKRAASKDDVGQAVEAKAKDDTLDVADAVLASSVPNTPHRVQPLQKSSSVTVVPQSLIRKQPPPVKRMLSEDNNNVIIVEKKDKKEQPKTTPAQEDAIAAARRKSSSRDSLQLQWQSSLEDNKEQRSRDSSISPVLDGVVLRKKSLPREGRSVRDDTPELMKVFARRSLKVRDSDAELTLSTLAQGAQAWETNGSSEQTQQQQTPPLTPPQTPPHTPPQTTPQTTPPQTTPNTTPQATPQTQQRASRDSDKENEGDGGDSLKAERTLAGLAPYRFQRSVSGGHVVQAQDQPPAVRPGLGPAAEKPAKPAKPVSAPATGDTVKDNNNSNRLRTRKPDNVITNGNTMNNINNNNSEKTTPTTPPPVSSVVAKMSARWTLPAEAKQTTVVVSPQPAQPTAPASNEPEGSPNVGAPPVPKFKRIQQRKEEWEQRAKALQRATQ